MATKAQHTRAIFYLPAGGALQVESVVLFGAAATMPATAHASHRTCRVKNRQILFTLSNTGFYMLALKRSLHVCRLQKKPNRSLQKQRHEH